MKLTIVLAILLSVAIVCKSQANSRIIEEQLKSLKTIQDTTWNQIKTLVEAQDRRFDQFEKIIDAIDRRFDRLSGSGVCVTSSDVSTGNLVDVGKITTCPDSWTPYRNEKCFKFFHDSKTYTEANDFCKFQSTFGYNATLASIRDRDEQLFVEDYLFIQNNPDDNVWIGVKRNPSNRRLIWEDNLNHSYTNWDPADNFATGNDCVEMQRETPLARDKRRGFWKSVQCRGRNLILCSSVPSPVSTGRPSTKPWPDVKPPLTKPYPDDRSLFNNDQSQGSIPYGFIYFQLPSQSEPTILWPNYNWEEVSRLYSGQFFRVEGAGSERFGVTQNDSAPRLFHVQHKKKDTNRGFQDEEITVPGDGNWSEYIYSGDRDYERHDTRYLRFRMTNDEVRPRNQAIRLWKRV